MLDLVDQIPDRCGDWKTTRISFPREEESFLIHHRDPVEAVRSLWGDPSLADHIVYKPSRVFRNKESETRVYSEMWTGKWWWAAQVRH